MTGIADVWLSRIGPAATATLRRSYRRNRAGGLLLILFVCLFVAFGVASGSSSGLLPVEVGEGTVLALTMVCEVALLSQSIRLQAQARREAALFHGLPVSAARYVPVRNYDVFDRWLSRRDEPGWPHLPSR